MASMKSVSWIIVIASLFFIFCSASASCHNVTAVFAIGDSTLDPGNNNHIGTLFVRNHPPYGRDFPGQVPTGRFTNGRLLTDFIVSHLGLKPTLPAYQDPNLKDEDLMTGASFASARSEIDDETAVLAHLLSMDAQVANFKKALMRIQGRVGSHEARRIINNALIVISSGTNDVLNNFYWLPISHRKFEFTLPQYHDFLLQRLKHTIRDLYNTGGRKFLVLTWKAINPHIRLSASTSAIRISWHAPTGCLLLQRTAGSIFPIFGPHTLHHRCVDQQNGDSQAYNTKLQALIARLSSLIPKAKFVYAGHLRTPHGHDTISLRRGFRGIDRGMLRGRAGRDRSSVPRLVSKCTNPSRYVFWDSIHPTEAAYSRIAADIIETALPRLIS